MIQRQSHTTLYVFDQDRAKAFYTQKLGFELREDFTLEGYRWLTVAPPGEATALVLTPIKSGGWMKQEDADILGGLVSRGSLGGGVFETADCRKTYEQLKERGVEFTSPPTERPYGVEAIFKDDSGNMFSLVQPSPFPMK